MTSTSAPPAWAFPSTAPWPARPRRKPGPAAASAAEPSSAVRPEAVARGRVHEQGRGQPSCLACREPGPGAGPAVRRGAEVEADPLRGVAASAEGEMAYPDLPPAHGAETVVKAGAAGARGPAVHDMPPRAEVNIPLPA